MLNDDNPNSYTIDAPVSTGTPSPGGTENEIDLTTFQTSSTYQPAQSAGLATSFPPGNLKDVAAIAFATNATSDNTAYTIVLQTDGQPAEYVDFNYHSVSAGQRLDAATQATLRLWIDRLGDEARAKFPEKVTAFRPEMAVHGKYGKPCPVCATPVRRIRRAENDSNYCARCQTGGKIVADGGLSQLLKADRPRTIDAEEAARAKRERR